MHTARLQALLAYLVLHRDAPLSRQQVAFLFWPDTTEAQAHTNLRQLLHALRHRLPQSETYLEVTDKTVRWREDASFALDVADFEAALVDAARTEGGTRLGALERAAATYGGDLLPGCYDDWLLLERARLAERFLAALEQLILLLEQRRDYGRAIVHAERLLHHDPLHEAACRHLMRLHAVNGDRAAALRVYHTCVTALERELGVPPGVETVEAYQQLLHLERGAALVSIPSGHAHLVGRHAEWQILQDLWRAVQRGGVHCVCLSGEVGIGKTRLAEEMLYWAGQQGIATAATRGYAEGGSLAYAPLVELLRAEALRPRVGQLPAIWRSELARLLPELLVEDPRLPQPEPLTARWQVQRLYDAVDRVLLRPDQPLILLLDDLQWFDAETLAWLHYLLHAVQQANADTGQAPRLLLLAALRREEIDQGHPVARLLLELRRGDQATELELAPLSAAETADLAARAADRRLDAAAAAAIHRTTEGNPLFIVETVRAGPITATGVGCAPDPPVTPKVQAVIRARLAQLSVPARELAGLAAVMGRSFAYDELALASDWDEDTVVHGLDELWRRRIIREQGLGAYDFSHDKIRDVTYAEMSQARRSLCHRRAAQALEALHAADLDPVCALIAAHYERAGLAEQAVSYYRLAAEVAQHLYANEDALGYVAKGLALLESLPDFTRRAQQELSLLIIRGDILAALKGHAAA